MAQTAPKVQTTRSADFVYFVADVSAVDPLNLTQIAEKPKCAAQRIRFFNSGGSAATVVVRPEVGPNQQVKATNGDYDVTVHLGILLDYTTEFPATHLVSASSADISAIVMWWYGTGIDVNKLLP